MSANERQHGGNHYQTVYQHWDYVHNAGLGYHAGNATKYVSRWRKKNGQQDLKKALHYVDKCEELGIGAPDGAVPATMEFTIANSMEVVDASVLHAIALGDWATAREFINVLLKRVVAEQAPSDAA